mmetsp:Transcript_22158/g.10585  ORF Transcript_22158/g.10585 Transcript_22158/m.10585 type:complete len:154 (-) Transcript_22158:920-1381(-)
MNILAAALIPGSLTSLLTIASLGVGALSSFSAYSQYRQEASSLRHQAKAEEENAKQDIAAINLELMRLLAKNEIAALAANVQSDTGTMAQIRLLNAREAEKARWARERNAKFAISTMKRTAKSRDTSANLGLAQGFLSSLDFLQGLGKRGASS